MFKDGVRPFQDPLAFGRETVEALTALDDRHTKFLFELPDPAGERGLGHVTRLGGAREMLFPRQRDEILKLSDIHER